MFEEIKHFKITELFNSRLKFCLFTIVDLLLERFIFSLESSLSTQTLRSGVGDFLSRVRIGVQVFV